MAGTHQERSDSVPAGYQMIRSLDIQNFRCFKHARLEKIARLNVVVGDNGSGKSSLLEAIFFAMGTTTQLAARFRSQRGLDGAFNSTRRRIEDAIWGELFHKLNFKEPIKIALKGDGQEARSVAITRGQWVGQASSVAITFTTAKGIERTLYPGFDERGSMQFPETGEDHADFFHFPAMGTIGSVENAGRFSDLSRARAQEDFVRTFVNEYKWLEDLNIEVIAGSAALYGTLKGLTDKVALPNISGGINRMVSIMAALASRQRAIALVDEIENGIYYKHQSALWKGLIRVLRDRDGQMICTTHSKEWLDALVTAAEGDLDDIMIWRVERGKDQPVVRQFTGQAIKAGLEMGTEPR